MYDSSRKQKQFTNTFFYLYNMIMQNSESCKIEFILKIWKVNIGPFFFNNNYPCRKERRWYGAGLQFFQDLNYFLHGLNFFSIFLHYYRGPMMNLRVNYYFGKYVNQFHFFF